MANDEHRAEGGMEPAPTEPTETQARADVASIPRRAPRKRPPGAGDFTLQPTLRRPAPELGPRARRTIERIFEATKDIFMTRGYAGTSVDDIAKAAGVSRASFYTYFPSKRDVLLALGSTATREANDVIDRLRQIPSDWTLADLESWLRTYIEFQDEYGAFAFAWTQAAHEDEEIRGAGMKSHLATCRRLGLALDALRGHSLGSPTEQGIIVSSMLDRTSALLRLYRPAVADDAMVRNLALAFAALLQEQPER